MAVEAQIIPQVETLSAEERVKRVDIEGLSPADAGILATDYFREQYDNFILRFTALRDKVPGDVVARWDEQAINFAEIDDSLKAGDARPLKHFVIHSGMEINRKSLNNQNNGNRNSLGNSLYGIGARMSPTVKSAS